MALRKVVAGTAAAVVGLGAILGTDNEVGKQIYAYTRPLAAWFFNRTHGERKRGLFSSMEGRICELHVGAGANFAYLPPLVDWQGVEPNEKLSSVIIDAGASTGLPPSLLKLDTENVLEWLKKQPAESVSHFLVTNGLCRGNAKEIVAEVLRVLEPGGRLYFVEPNAREEGSPYRLIQKALSPITSIYGAGYRMDQDIAKIIHEAGFVHVYTEQWPRRLDPRHPRMGITIVTYDPEKKQLSQLSGWRPLVAGVAVKKNRSVLADYWANAMAGGSRLGAVAGMPVQQQ